MMKKSLSYSAITLAVTLVIGQILLILFSEGNSIGSSVLFIFNELKRQCLLRLLLQNQMGRKQCSKICFCRESLSTHISWQSVVYAYIMVFHL